MFPARAGMNRWSGWDEAVAGLVFPARAGMNRAFGTYRDLGTWCSPRGRG